MRKYLFTILVLFFKIGVSWGQTYPVMANLQIYPPYPLYINQYATDNLLVTLNLLDLDQTGLQIKLKFIIEGENGIHIETRSDISVPPIILADHVTTINGSDLQPYFDINNMFIQGVDNDFYRTKLLPEGTYTFSVKVLDYRRGKEISNTAFTVVQIVLNDPPVWVQPSNNQIISWNNPQMVIFSWLPQHNPTLENVSYRFFLYRIIEHAGPKDQIFQSPPVYSTTVDQPMLVLYEDDYALEPGAKYGALVQAYSLDNVNIFKNEGFSEPVYFIYAQQCLPPAAIQVYDIKQTSAKIAWLGSEAESYKMMFREVDTNDNGAWYFFYVDSNYKFINLLKANTQYEFKIKSVCQTSESDFSDIYQFKTKPIADTSVECANSPQVPEIDTTAEELTELNLFDTITVAGFPAIITDVKYNDGKFSGTCIIFVNNLGLLFKARLEDVKVNTAYQVTDGNVIVERGEGITLDLANIMQQLGDLASQSIDSITSDIQAYLNQVQELINILKGLNIRDLSSEQITDLINTLEGLTNSDLISDNDIERINAILQEIRSIQGN